MDLTKDKIGPLILRSLRTKRGIKVTGAYVEDFNPEMQAALGATLSRDPGSIESRLEKIFGNKEMSQRILETFFKNYGHNSIGDMGTIMFSIEGLSMKGAFHAVEHRLFNGQEASTRYLDFSKMGFLPVNKEVDGLSKEWISLYEDILESEIEKNIRDGYSEKEARPKAFDVAGAFLPISARTNVYWYGSIRVLIEQIRKLRSGTDEEKEIGEAMSKVFDFIAPNSQRDAGEDSMYKENLFNNHLQEYIVRIFEHSRKRFVSYNGFNTNSFKFATANTNVLPAQSLGFFGSIAAYFTIDFRSARDIHRHRAFHLNSVYDWGPRGIHKFYYEKVCDLRFKERISGLNAKSMKLFKDIGGDAIYAFPMATKFNYLMSGGLQAWLYFLKLRSGPKVHPTVIDIAQAIGKDMECELGLENVYQRGGADYGQRSKDENKV